MQKCMRNGIQPLLAQAYDPNIYYVRNKCLGGNVLRGIHQKPFGGTLSYDLLLWIDSDIVFSFEQLVQLIKRDKDIVAGHYLMQGGKQLAVVEDWDTDYFKANGTFRFMTPEDLAGKTDLFEVAYTGFGFVLMKYGVMESLDYPWFRPVNHDMGEISDFSSEDASMCCLLREKGFKIFVDPMVKVGHEKEAVL